MKNEIIKEIESFILNADESAINFLVRNLEGTSCSIPTIEAIKKLADTFNGSFR